MQRHIPGSADVSTTIEPLVFKKFPNQTNSVFDPDTHAQHSTSGSRGPLSSIRNTAQPMSLGHEFDKAVAYPET